MKEIFRLSWGVTAFLCQLIVSTQLVVAAPFILNVLGTLLFIQAIYGAFSYIEYAVKIMENLARKGKK